MTPIERLELIVYRTAQEQINDSILYAGLGLTSEAGEVAGEIKKVLRNDGGRLTEDRKERILDELSDVLWYVQLISDLIDTDLPEIIEHLDFKLSGRVVRGEINER